MTVDDTIRIVLVDDEQMVRSGLRMILESEDGLVVFGRAHPDHVHAQPAPESLQPGDECRRRAGR